MRHKQISIQVWPFEEHPDQRMLINTVIQPHSIPENGKVFLIENIYAYRTKYEQEFVSLINDASVYPIGFFVAVRHQHQVVLPIADVTLVEGEPRWKVRLKHTLIPSSGIASVRDYLSIYNTVGYSPTAQDKTTIVRKLEPLIAFAKRYLSITFYEARDRWLDLFPDMVYDANGNMFHSPAEEITNNTNDAE